MPQIKGKDGRFKAGDRKQHVSLRLPAELRDRLRLLPSMSKYIETVLLEKMAEMPASPDPDWDYYQEWEKIMDLIVAAGAALRKIQQCEERCEEGDAAIEGLHETFMQF